MTTISGLTEEKTTTHADDLAAVDDSQDSWTSKKVKLTNWFNGIVAKIGSIELNGTANTLTASGGVLSIEGKPLGIEQIGVAISDEDSALTTGAAKLTFRMPFAMTLTDVRASLTGAGGSSGLTTIDINESGSTILSTKLTIDFGEKTSETAVTPAVIDDADLADDAEITIDIDTVTGDADETGAKVWLIGTRT